MYKHLIKLLDLSKEDIIDTLNLAQQLKFENKQGIKHRLLEGKTLAMIFEKPSTRTRVSFETGMYQLGGHALILSRNELQMGRGESVEDTARVLSRYVDGIMIRALSHSMVAQLAVHASVPVINGCDDFEHPCQVLADLMTVREHKGKLEGLKLCFIGDGNNMANSLIVGGLKVGMRVSCACPEGYTPHKDILDFAKGYCGAFELVHDPKVAAKDADVMVTDVWASMGQEDEAAARALAFKSFCVDAEIMALAAPGAMIQHCLPAHKGEEITEEVFEAHAQEIFDEAENRLHAQKAVLVKLMG